MARLYDVDDSHWDEVKYINGYALFMGYLMMGVRGLGLLIITWTAVIRLGSVSALGNKDFWCLTCIMLIQTVGVFNFLLKEKISDTVHSWWGLSFSVIATFKEDGPDIGTKRFLISLVFMVIKVLVIGVILCALGVVYMFGMYISAGVSLWRLIKHDFGDAGGANQRPTLEVLYILAVAQGVLFGYKTMYGLVAGSGRLAKGWVQGAISELDKELIEEYMEKTVAGCEKNLSFASGRNFVTYGVDLIMEANSSKGFISGIRFLGVAIKSDNPSGTKVLAKYLLTRPSDSSSAIIQRLLETVGPRSPYSREVKEHVVRILDVITAPCIRLEQFPRAIECLCSCVVDTFDSDDDSEPEESTTLLHIFGGRFKDYEGVDLMEEYEEDYIKYELRNGSPDSFLGILQDLLYKCLRCKTEEKVENGREQNTRWAFDQLPIKAMNMIHKLVADEHNRSIMRTCVPNNTDMLHKIIAMFPTKKLHRENHYPCRVGVDHKSELQMLEQCWVLTEWWLLVAVTETSSPPLLPAATPVTIKDGIESTIKCIFDCLDCSATQKRQAIQILLHLSLYDTMSFIVENSESSRRRLSWVLLLILCSTDDDSKYWMVPSLTYPNNNSCCDFNGIRRLAGEKLSEMLQEEHGELPSEETGTGSQLVGLPLQDLKTAFGDDSEDISIRTHAIIIMEGLCRIDYTNYPEVEAFMVDAIPKVVKETLDLCGSNTTESQEQVTDLENGNNVSHDNQDSGIETQRLRKALASLCYHGYILNSNSTMWSKFKEIASITCEEQWKPFWDFERLILRSVKNM